MEAWNQGRKLVDIEVAIWLAEEEGEEALDERDLAIMTMKTPAPVNQTHDIIEILDPAMRKGFAQIPRVVLRAQGLSRNAKCLYALLLDYAWQEGSCFPGQRRLAEDLAVTDRTIRADLNELRTYGLIDWKRRGLSLSNVYSILPLAACDKLKVLEPRPEADRKNSSGLDRKPASALDRKHASDDVDSANQDTPQQHRVVAGKQETATDESANHAEQADALVAALITQGLSATTARRFIRRYPADYLRRHLDIHAVRLASPARMTNPAGVLRKAIEEDWAPPAGHVSAEERQARERKNAEEAKRLDEMLQRHDAAATRAHRKANATAVRHIPSAPIPSSHLTTAAAWNQVTDRLKRQLSKATFATLLRHTQLLRVEGSVATITAPSPFAAELLQRRLQTPVRLALSDVLEQDVSVAFVALNMTTADNTSTPVAQTVERARTAHHRSKRQRSNTRAVRVHSLLAAPT